MKLIGFFLFKKRVIKQQQPMISATRDSVKQLTQTILNVQWEQRVCVWFLNLVFFGEEEEACDELDELCDFDLAADWFDFRIESFPSWNKNFK